MSSYLENYIITGELDMTENIMVDKQNMYICMYVLLLISSNFKYICWIEIDLIMLTSLNCRLFLNNHIIFIGILKIKQPHSEIFYYFILQTTCFL